MTLTAPHIIERVSKEFGIELSSMRSRDRRGQAPTARMAAYYLLKDRRRLSYQQIALYMRKDPSTIFTGIVSIKHLMAQDPALRAKVEGCA